MGKSLLSGLFLYEAKWFESKYFYRGTSHGLYQKDYKDRKSNAEGEHGLGEALPVPTPRGVGAGSRPPILKLIAQEVSCGLLAGGGSCLPSVENATPGKPSRARRSAAGDALTVRVAFAALPSLLLRFTEPQPPV